MKFDLLEETKMLCVAKGAVLGSLVWFAFAEVFSF